MDKKLSPKILTKGNNNNVVLAQDVSQLSINSVLHSSQAPTATSPQNVSFKINDTTYRNSRNSGGSDSKVLTPGQVGAAVRFETPTRSEPDSKATIDSYLKSQRTNPDSIMEINSRLKVLQGVIKKRMIEIYKEKKALSVVPPKSEELVVNNAQKDSEQFDKFLQVYAQLTSCINLIIGNDTQAQKLLILSPIIEKHITQLTRDQKNFLAGCKNDEIALTSPTTVTVESVSDT